MGARSFLVDVIASGSVLGMGVGDTPDQVAGRLGDSFLEDKTRSSMRRDYGLVEFFWSRMSGRGPWLSAGFTVQVHRLATEPALRDGRWGRLGPRVPFAALRSDLAPLGFQCSEITVHADRPDWRRYWNAEALIAIQVARTRWTGVLRAGDVFAIHAPHTAATVAADTMRSRRQSVRDGLAHLLSLDDAGRRAWLDRRQAAAADRVNWWLYLIVVTDSRLSDQPASRPEWIDLRVWLMREGLSRGMISPVRHAADMAYFVLAMRASRATSPRLPTADIVVQACLDAIGVPPERAIARDGDGRLITFDRAAVLSSRQANTLLSAAQWHLDALDDPELAGRLQDWMSFRHLLA
ncbi:MAG TPA: hypothetical protein VMG38_24700 [Trebonia sp.]|nr:hypothetical protein [Trebonia sp.]